ncbi:hypothetical protein ACTS94_02900 [Empedobacter falsenii]
MSRTRIVKGTYTKITKGKYNMYAGGNTNITALGKNNFKGDNHTVYGNNPLSPPVFTTEKTRVKTIICTDKLEEGAANDGFKYTTEMAILNGKSYKFEVNEFTDGEPLNEKSIRWKVSCINPDTGDTYDNILQDKDYKGKSISINFNVTNYCGYKITVKAYIENSEAEGEFSTFIHYSFKWFDRKIINDEIKDRINTGKNIDQGWSSMCGVALIGHFLAIQNPEEYKRIILDLHRKGEVTIEDTGYEIKIDNDKHLLDVKPLDIKYPKNSDGNQIMSFADYVFLFTIKDQLNNIFDYDPNGPDAGGTVEGLTGLTLPNEIDTMMRRILNYIDIKEETNIATSKWSSAKNSYIELSDLLANNYSIALFINADNFTNNKKGFFSIPNHWVGLKNISIDEINETFSVTVFTWGKIDEVWKVDFDVFKDGFFGYVAGKK